MSALTDQTALFERAGDRELRDSGAFRPIQYLGSKVRILDAIEQALDAVDPRRGHTLDMFSGSGVVASRLAETRHVTAVDIQEYARVLASALLAPYRFAVEEIHAIVERSEAAFEDLAGPRVWALTDYERAAMQAIEDEPDAFCEILEHGSFVALRLSKPSTELVNLLSPIAADFDAKSSQTTLTRYYGGVYFSYEQALRLDCLLTAIRELEEGPRRDTALAAALGAASECVSSIGNHFAQPIRPRDKAGQIKLGALRAARGRRGREVRTVFADRVSRYGLLAGARHRSHALCRDYRDLLSQDLEVAAAYADPPYTRDHYSRFYHVLETMAVGDDPAVSSVTVDGKLAVSRGLYRADRHQSPFCIRTQASDAFRALLSGVRRLGAPLVLSYSPYSQGTAARPRPRLLTIDDVGRLATEFYRRVDIVSPGPLSHSKFNRADVNGAPESEAELLLVCRP